MASYAYNVKLTYLLNFMAMALLNEQQNPRDDLVT